MKLRKTLAIIMTAALTVGTMAGCSQSTLNYAKELSNTAKWGASTSTVEGAINVDAQGVQKEIKFTVDGQAAGDKAFADMKFTDPAGQVNIPELKVYVDGATVYVNKDFYQGIYSMSGQASPQGLANISQEYIAIDSASSQVDTSKIKALTSQSDGMAQLGKLIFGENSDLDLPFVQNGREYTLNLDSDKATDLAVKALKAMKDNVGNLNSTLNTNATADDVSKIKISNMGSEFDIKSEDVKTALAGSTISLKDTFTDTSYNSDFNMNLKVKDFGNISLTMQAKSSKSDVKEISIPTSTIKVTQEQFNQMMAEKNTDVAAK